MKIGPLIVLTCIVIIVGYWFYGHNTEPIKQLLNASFDPTRELFQELNKNFTFRWQEQNDQDLCIYQSHGASGKQARSVTHGLQADVLTLAIRQDIDMIAKEGLLRKDWANVFPNNSSPYGSTILFLVRKNNPKNIKDWEDLVRPGYQVVTPNPKISGGAMWNYLAAFGCMKQKYQDHAKTIEYMFKLFKNVPLLDNSARNAMISFVTRDVGDVLLTWENEAFLAIENFGPDKFDVVVPSCSIEIDLPVAIVDKVARKHKNYKLAKEYLNYMFSDDGQEIIAKYYYRPFNQQIFEKHSHKFPKVNLLKLEQLGIWNEIRQQHFDNGGIFDQIYAQ